MAYSCALRGFWRRAAIAAETNLPGRLAELDQLSDRVAQPISDLTNNLVE